MLAEDRDSGSVRVIDATAVLSLAAALLLPAIANGFPLVFPDSGTYLSIAFDHGYATDRSSIYGLFLKPLVQLPGVISVWAPIAVQCVIVGCVLWAALRMVSGTRARLLVAMATVLLTSVSLHAAQLMPDAFTGVAVLLAWMAARRDLSRNGTALLWLAVSAAALMHYTHLALVAVAALATLCGERAAGVPWARLRGRLGGATAAIAFAVLVQVAVNGMLFGQRKIAPAGPVFLYARLTEDGFITPWLARHCGKDAPQLICELAPRLPRDSQSLLWSRHSPVRTLIWSSDPKDIRWDIVDAMAEVNRRAIESDPVRFGAVAAGAAARQFVTFAPLDDECPTRCRSGGGGVAQALNKYRPEAAPALDRSLQVTERTPKPALQAIMIPAAALALALMPFLGFEAWRRRDRDSLTLIMATFAALTANAALAGALSDIHDRYQSRLVWLAPFVVLVVCARTGLFRRDWRRRLSLPDWAAFSKITRASVPRLMQRKS